MMQTYEFTQNPDGTFNVLDVPIFGEVPAKNPHGKPPFSAAWLHKAVENDKNERARGYTAPLHVLHHEPGVQSERAGGIELTVVRKMLYQGKKIATVFANLVQIPKAIFERIQKGELPYRSVEIIAPSENRISSLALLDSEEPFFRFPNLRVGNRARHLVNSPAVLACAKSGAAGSYLFKAGETNMDDTTASVPETDTPETAPVAEPVTREEFTALRDGLADLTKLLTTKFAAEEAVEEVTEEAEAEHFEAPETVPSHPVSPEEINEGLEAPIHPSTGGGTFKAEARILALEERLRKEDAEKEANARFAAAEADLVGYNLSDEALAGLKRAAFRNSEDLACLVETFKATLSKDPAPTLADALGSSDSSDSDEVAVYAAQSPELGTQARKLEAQFRSLKSQGLTSNLATFLKINMTAPKGQE